MLNEQIKAAAYAYRAMYDTDIGLTSDDLTRLTCVTTSSEIRALEDNQSLSSGQADCLINEL